MTCTLEEAIAGDDVRDLLLYPPDVVVLELSHNFNERTQRVVELVKKKYPWYWKEYQEDFERISREGPDPGKPKDVEYLASYWRYRAQQLQERLIECQGRLATMKKALKALENKGGEGRS